MAERDGLGEQFSTRTLRSLVDIDAVAGQWLALEQSCKGKLSYFQTYSWCRNWAANFCGPGGPVPYIRTVWRGAELVALWPLMIVGSAWTVRRLETFGVPHSQYCNYIHRPDLDLDAIAALLVRDLGDEAAFDVAVFKTVPADSSLCSALAHFPAIRGFENASSVLDLSAYASPEDYTAQLGKLQKRKRNRRRNHLSRLGDVSFDVIWPDDPDFAALVQEGVAMKRRWLTETSRFSVGTAANNFERFLSQLDGDASNLSGACLSVLRVDRRVVALELGFIHKAHYYAYLGAFDWDLRDLSPGKIQMEFTVAWLIENGVEAYDLLANPADYKRTWSNHDVELRGFALPLNWKGRIYTGAWLPTLRPALKRAHAGMVELSRRVLLVTQGIGCIILHV